MLIDEIEYVIFRHPGLAQIPEFMIGFGLLELQQTADHLYLRSYVDAPFSYVTAAGDAAFLGMGFRVASREALAQLAARFDCPASECPHPGGGLYVVGSDPDGRRLEFVFDAKRLAPTPSDGLRSCGMTGIAKTALANSRGLLAALPISSASVMPPFSRRRRSSSSPGTARTSA